MKRGCPYCREAMDYLDEQKVAYQKTDVVGNAAAMEELKTASGQTKTPTLVCDGKVLANFGIPELEGFLKEQGKG
ncbi:MAG: glutaredoxin family protein [Chthoniobacterales bacterium]